MAKRTYATDADQDSDLPRLIQQQQQQQQWYALFLQHTILIGSKKENAFVDQTKMLAILSRKCIIRCVMLER